MNVPTCKHCGDEVRIRNGVVVSHRLGNTFCQRDTFAEIEDVHDTRR